jgi:hypothetical protein
LVEWLILLKTKLLKKNPKWKLSCFIVDDVPQKLWALQWILFSLYLFLNFNVYVTISNFHPTFSIVNNVINWNNDKFIFYAWLRLCGVRTKCSPLHMACLKSLVLTFDRKNQRQWGAMRNIGWPSHCHVHAHWTTWKHWSLHGSWDKQYHWMFHTSSTWWFMNLALLDLLFPSWYMNWLSIHYCCFIVLCISQSIHSLN